MDSELWAIELGKRLRGEPLSRMAVNKWERCVVLPKYEALQAAAQVLDIEVGALLD